MKVSKKIWVWAFLTSAVLVFASCDKDKKDDPKLSTANHQIVEKFQWSEKGSEQAQIKIINEFGEPVVGAQILIGEAQGSPFRNNFFTTDKSGLAVVPVDWTENASVSVDAKSYIRQTLLDQAPGHLTIKLSPAPLSNPSELTGVVTQLPVVNGDKLIDFALVIPALSKADLLNFDINQVISPYSDKLSAAGMTNDMPSNVSLPKQTENYFINVTLDKSIYRLKMAQLGTKRFVATKGRFVFKDVVNDLRAGKPFYELINHFSITGGGMREVVLTGGSTKIDIPSNELNFDSKITVQPATALSDEIQMVLATSELAGTMVPTDIKKAVNGKSITMQSMNGQKTYIINVIKKQSEFMSTAGRMSASLVPYQAGTASKLLPIIGNPNISSNGQYIIDMPQPPQAEGIFSLATTAVISDLVEIDDNGKKISLPIKKWEVLGLGWNQKIKLPKWPLAASTSKKRIEVNFIGTNNPNATPSVDNSLIENATHITHAAVDL